MEPAQLMGSAIISAMNASSASFSESLVRAGEGIGQALGEQLRESFSAGGLHIEEALQRGAVTAAEEFYDRFFREGGLFLMLWMFFVIALIQLFCIVVIIAESMLIVRMLRRALDDQRIPRAVMHRELTRADTPESFLTESTFDLQTRATARLQGRDI